MAKLLEIHAIVTEARWPVPDSDFVLARGRLVDGQNADAPIAIIGNAEREQLDSQLEYLFYGSWDEHPKYGRQFKFSTYVRTQPHGRAGTINYLKQAPHVGVATASALWDKFVGNAVRILRETPEVACAAIDASYFTLDKAKEAARTLWELAALENCTIELFDLFDGRGFPKRTAQDVIRKHGNLAPRRIKHDPYELLSKGYKGIGFSRADALYQDLGLPPNRLKRQAMCAVHAINADRDGNTWLPVGTAVAGIEEKVGGTRTQPTKAIRLAQRAGRLAVRSGSGDCENCGGQAGKNPSCGFCRGTGGRIWLADAGKAADERELAELIAQASIEDSVWQELLEFGDAKGYFDRLKVHHNGHQFEQLKRATSGGCIAIFGGSPGTGKTFCAATLIKAIIDKYGRSALAVCAPTGKAAVRITEAMAEYEIKASASTIHRLLKVTDTDGDGFSFHYGLEQKLPVKFLVVDETSMVGTRLLLDLLRARAAGTHILLVGDINQLPPISHGAPLRDMIAAELPYGELTEIHRNAGTAVRACQQIREGKPFDVDDTPAIGAEPPRNLIFVPSVGAITPQRIVGILRKIKAGGKFDPIWDCQVVCAVNAKSPLARKKLNQLLQQELNPNGKTVKGCPFRVGDKVMQLKNKFLKVAKPEAVCSELAGLQRDLKYVKDLYEGIEPEFNDDVVTNDSGQVLICNGEFGKVVDIDERAVTIEILNPSRFVTVPIGKAGKDADGEADEESGGVGDMTLAYACTCHKLQGSQCPIIIIALDEYPGATGRFGVCKREWLNTAISRLQRCGFLVGKMQTAERMCAEQALPNRKTFLRELIVEFTTALQQTPEAIAKESMRKYQEAKHGLAHNGLQGGGIADDGVAGCLGDALNCVAPSGQGGGPQNGVQC